MYPSWPMTSDMHYCNSCLIAMCFVFLIVCCSLCTFYQVTHAIYMHHVTCHPGVIMASCNICSKRVQNHSFHMECSFCHGKVHLSKSVRVTGVSLYNHFKSLICLKVSYVTYKYNLKRHIIDNNTMNLVKTSWPKLPWCIMYHFDKCQIVTMEALSSLYQD